MVYVDGTLTVGQATLTVTAGNASRAYGAANPAFTASAAGAQNGDTFSFTESTTAVVASPAGTYPIVPVATGANLANYTVVYVNGTLTVGQATLTVTAGNASRAYGAANPAFTASAAGAQNGDTFSFTESTTAVVASPAGTYPIVPVLQPVPISPTTPGRLRQPGTLTVGQATLTVNAAGNASRAYGAANLTFTGTIRRPAHRTVTPSQRRSPRAPQCQSRHSPAGTYTIVPVAAGTPTSPTTPSSTSITALLTVGQATLTVTAGNASRAYGAANPAFTGTVNVGAQNGDTFTVTESTTTATRRSPVQAPTRSFLSATGAKPRQLHGGLRQRNPDHRARLR